MPRLSLQDAAREIRAGRVVAVPTQTFYGLAADARNPQAIEKVLRLKKRKPEHPMPVLVPDSGAIACMVRRGLEEREKKLIEAFWPGALTLIFAGVQEGLSPYITRGGTIGLRQDGHPELLNLLALVQGPVTGTSANLSGMPSLRFGAEVDGFFAGEEGYAGWIGTDEPTPGDKASTIVGWNGTEPVIVRDGPVSRAQILDALKPQEG